MRRIVTLIMCVWMLASCQESREEAMLRLVNEWNGKNQVPCPFGFYHSRKGYCGLGIW